MFLADDGIARFCTETYETAAPNNLNNIYMHITNFNINKHSKKCVDDSTVQDILNPNNANKRTLKAVLEEIKQKSKNP